MSRSARRPRSLPAAAALALALALGGCTLLPERGPDPTRHFVLTGPSPAAVNEAAKIGGLKVGLRSVQIAPYLDGKSMVVRRGDNEIDYREYARWAEPLAIGINRMLVARLHLSEQVARVFPQPYPFDIERDLDVSVNVLRCEGRVRPDGRTVASFLCGIEIVRVGGDGPGEVIRREVFEAAEIEWSEGDHAALAAHLSSQVAELAEFIVSALPGE
jgi:uncharacterized lipoprotein YmbA